MQAEAEEAMSMMIQAGLVEHITAPPVLSPPDVAPGPTGEETSTGNRECGGRIF